ncbi:MAG: hypothetical protein WAS33_09260 [Candidatus Promineifilaceae bacterium]|jgi:hypothetical protein|nr:hypothetical protein [Anaerolineaceae bacterium]
MMWDYFGIMLGSGIGAVVFGYSAFYSWFRANQFREMIAKRSKKYSGMPLYHFSQRWVQSKSYFWFVRIQSFIFFTLCAGLFLMGIIGPLFSIATSPK